MFQDTPAWREQVRKRMRTNAHLAIRHDAHRFMPPGSPRYVGKDVVNYFWPEQRSTQPARADDIDHGFDSAAEPTALLRLRSELAAIKFQLKLRRLLRDGKAYHPNQPRVPSGSREGGQWTSEGSEGAKPIRVAQLGAAVTDAYGEPYYNPGGHHEVPKQVYEKWQLRPETLQAFKQATTGPVPDWSLRTTPDGAPSRHYWGGAENLHKSYNGAVQDLADRFLEKNGITPEQMSPEHARALLREVRESDDPRIRDYNRNIRTMRRLFRLRPGAD
jgi:hypothetical protein